MISKLKGNMSDSIPPNSDRRYIQSGLNSNKKNMETDKEESNNDKEKKRKIKKFIFYE
jgi:hypothetical protein